MARRKFSAVKAIYREGMIYHLMVDFVIAHIFSHQNVEYFKLVTTKGFKSLFPGEYNINVDHIRQMIVSYGSMVRGDVITLAIPVEFVKTKNGMHRFTIHGDIPGRKHSDTILLESMARKHVKKEK